MLRITSFDEFLKLVNEDKLPTENLELLFEPPLVSPQKAALNYLSKTESFWAANFRPHFNESELNIAEPYKKDNECYDPYIYLGAENVKILASHLKKLPAGTIIRLFRHNIGDQGLKYLAEAIQNGDCPPDVRFCLEDNHITDEGFIALIDALQNSRCPQGLMFFLDYNSIGNRGGDALAQALNNKKIPPFTYLKLAFNKLTDVTPVALAIEKGHYPDAFYLNIAKNNLSVNDANDLTRALTNNPNSSQICIEAVLNDAIEQDEKAFENLIMACTNNNNKIFNLIKENKFPQNEILRLRITRDDQIKEAIKVLPLSHFPPLFDIKLNKPNLLNDEDFTELKKLIEQKKTKNLSAFSTFKQVEPAQNNANNQQDQMPVFANNNNNSK